MAPAAGDCVDELTRPPRPWWSVASERPVEARCAPAGASSRGGWLSGPGDVVRAAVERVNANDFAGYYELLVEGVVMVTETRTLTGKSAVIAELEASFQVMSNNWMTIDRLVVSGGHVATWLTVGGDIVKSGLPWHVEGCTVWEVRDGAIASIREYYDWSPLLHALGAASDA